MDLNKFSCNFVAIMALFCFGAVFFLFFHTMYIACGFHWYLLDTMNEYEIMLRIHELRVMQTKVDSENYDF